MPLALALLLAAAVERVEVHVAGVGFTSEAAVRRLMSLRPGGEFDEAHLERDLARLRTLGILYDLSARGADDGRRVEVQVKDRWSLVPVLGLRHGGGRTTARAGLSDHNVAGQLATLYGEVTSNAEVPFLGGGKLGTYLYGEVASTAGGALPGAGEREEGPAIGQLAAFSDGGWVADRAGAIAGLDYQGPIQSTGAGGRYIPIPFARAVGRLDLAVGLIPRRTLDISFSGQQFF